ncbi:MAG: hypothetical protein WB947_07150 [Thermoplasmata archaeon]
MPHPEERIGHACVTRDCGHPQSDHVATPELAGTREVVIWCASCRRHEVRRPSRFRLPWTGSERPRARRRVSRPS